MGSINGICNDSGTTGEIIVKISNDGNSVQVTIKYTIINSYFNGIFTQWSNEGSGSLSNDLMEKIGRAHV